VERGICPIATLLARDAQAKLALIVAQIYLSVHPSVHLSVCLSATATQHRASRATSTTGLYRLRFTLVSYDFLQPMLVSNSNISLKMSTFGSRDIVGHVTVRPAIYGVLQVVNYNHTLILHGDVDLKTEVFWAHV